MHLYIYFDEGVSLFSFEQIKRSLADFFPESEILAIDAHEVRAGEWAAKASLLAIPGGRDIPYDRKLRGQANGAIRRFVEEGGVYLGICAGAYYGAKRVVFEKGLPLEVEEERELGFFPGSAVGTLYRPGLFDYDSSQGAYPAHVRIQNEAFYAYYNGGCAFESAEQFEEVNIEGTYCDAHDRAAVVLCQVGKGRALLSGVHLEYSALSLPAQEIPAPHLEKLRASEQRRESLFKRLLYRELRKNFCKRGDAKCIALA